MNKSMPDFKMFAAVKLAVKRLFALFPVNGKFPFKGSNGHKDASTETKVIKRLWEQHPLANIAIACGDPSGIFVVDIDIKPDGTDGLASLHDAFGNQIDIDPESQLVTKTPHGGLHLYYTTEGVNPKTRQGVLPGVDIRGNGGYVLAPPSSLNVDGKWVKYKYVNPDAPIPPAPQWVKDLLAMDSKPAVSQPHTPADGKSSDPTITALCEGQRDEGLYKYACSLRGRDVSFDQAQLMMVQASLKCIPPFDTEQAIKKLRYAYDTYPAGSARTKKDSGELKFVSAAEKAAQNQSMKQ